MTKRHYRVWAYRNDNSKHYVGMFKGESPADAMNDMARAAGFDDFANMCGVPELDLHALTPDELATLAEVKLVEPGETIEYRSLQDYAVAVTDEIRERHGAAAAQAAHDRAVKSVGENKRFPY